MKDYCVKLNQGFTLLEILLVMALVSMLASFGLFVSMDNYNQSSFLNERNLLLSALTHARAQSINNVCLSTPTAVCTDGKPHGVHLEISGGYVASYVVFQGTSYNSTDATNEIIKTNYAVTSTGASDVYFQQLSGNVASPVSMTLNGYGSESSDINIGTEGQIYWTK